ncbi:MAG: diguanylate cyclase [Rhodocyclaceae bacterium]|nr:diguanylate cyclase [Rhodocyclaceae bacterium]
MTTEMSAAAATALPRVMIVDDSRIVRATIIKHIRGSFEVREETDGEAGWEALLVDPSIQVVISDLTMPHLDGYGLLERIRGSHISRIREIPVIMISGDEDEASRARAKNLGATDFITKGIGTAELLTRLDTLVKLSRTHQDLEQSRRQEVADPVSGMLSKAFMMRQADQAFAHVQRHGGEVCILVLGFDAFDALTARLGAGIESLLGQFGKMLSAHIRREDSLARCDNHEFAVLIPDAGLADVSAFARRVREAVSAARISLQGEAIHVTVSVGVASFQVDAPADMAALLGLARERMRQAQAEGGDRVAGIEGQRPPLVAPPGVEQALALLALGKGGELEVHLPALAHALLPLLAAIDRHYQLDLPLQRLEQLVANPAANSSNLS